MPKENMVGIVSDTHDNRDCIVRAVSFFNRRECGLVIHAGDFVAPFTVREFEKLEGKFTGVYGNNDGEKPGLAEQFARIGEIHEPPYEFAYAGKRFAVMHSPQKLDRFLARDDIDVIIYGHTHKVEIRRGRPLVVNPGECCSWLTGRSTAAILDLSDMRVEIFDLDIEI
ncbi:MAG: metallophosphoesterase [Candidatus Latescibacterota bacterium]